ncbi:Fe(3+) dicitrate ABC transporter ATP-binding protein FecE [Escherichia coli]|nr:Fe(3+) dicitrate ABC transporter ATP-binding protein FecE [Escherichia coli]EKQ9077479.1 Fe(3+) dicitrate ABC transporter ATP-binding protein FecE [Escherichia coli]ELI5991073.1 Fe(3+) dicitrate ABC transporter ATP-binding protein FecE [Escherichia coli]
MTLRTENLTVSYGTDKVLNDVSLSLPTGKITALIGPNGCGKSTLLNCFSRLLMPQSGTVFLGDNPINMLSSRQLARRLSLLPQHHLTPEGITVQELGCGKSTLLNCFSRLLMPQSGTVFLGDNPINMLSSRQLARRLSLLPQHHLTPEGITVQELVSYGRNPWLSLWGRLSAEDNARVNVAMNQTRINHLAVRRLTELSGGQRQRAFLAMVLAQNTPVVLLDEPTTYLDINHQVDLMRLMGELRTQGKTVVAVLHDLNQASRYCDQLVVMANGHVMAQGTPEEVMTPGLLRTVFSVEAEIHPEPVSGRPMCLMR